MDEAARAEEAGSELDLADVLASWVSSALGGFLTALPGKVIAFDAARGRVSAKPYGARTVRNPDTGEETTKPYAVVREAPVLYPAGMLGGLTWPLQQGDRVLLVMTSTGLDQWLAGSEQPPPRQRRNQLRDAVAIAGLFPTRSIPGATVVGGDAVWLAGTNLGTADRVARERDLTALKTILLGAADGVGYGSAVKTAINAPPGWPNVTSKTRSG